MSIHGRRILAYDEVNLKESKYNFYISALVVASSVQPYTSTVLNPVTFDL
jgi:hypothetical protein